jgi:hypothetical protein
MASPRIDSIQAALATTLSRIPSVSAYGYVPRTFNYTQAIIVVQNYSSQRDTFVPQYTYTFDLEIYCLAQVPDYGQIMLAQLMSPTGPNSIEGTLMNDPTLGGVVDDVAVEPYQFTAAHAAMTWKMLGDIEFVQLIRPIEVYA